MVAAIIRWVLRILIGGVFLAFGGLKLMDPTAFVEDVANFQISPFDEEPWDMWLAYGLIGAEILAGFFLLVPKGLHRGALIMVGGMVVAFLVAIGTAWSRGLNIECGCSGKEYDVMGGYGSHMAILVLLLAGVVWLMIEELFPSKRA